MKISDPPHGEQTANKWRITGGPRQYWADKLSPASVCVWERGIHLQQCWLHTNTCSVCVCVCVSLDLSTEPKGMFLWWTLSAGMVLSQTLHIQQRGREKGEGRVERVQDFSLSRDAADVSGYKSEQQQPLISLNHFITENDKPPSSLSFLPGSLTTPQNIHTYLQFTTVLEIVSCQCVTLFIMLHLICTPNPMHCTAVWHDELWHSLYNQQSCLYFPLIEPLLGRKYL